MIVRALVAGLILLFAAPAVRAQEAGQRAAPRVIELEALTIEGRIAKPQVFYVLGRSRIDYENLKLKRVFVDRILDSARKNRF